MKVSHFLIPTEAHRPQGASKAIVSDKQNCVTLCLYLKSMLNQHQMLKTNPHNHSVVVGVAAVVKHIPLTIRHTLTSKYAIFQLQNEPDGGADCEVSLLSSQ